MGSEQRRALLAVVLSGIVLFGWQYYFAPHKDVATDTTQKAVETTAPTNVQTDVKAVSTATVATNTAEVSNVVTTKTLKTDLVTLDFNSDLTINAVKGATTQVSVSDTVGDKKFFNFYVNNNGKFELLNYNFTEVSPKVIKGTESRFSSNIIISIKENGRLDYSINSTNPLTYRIVIKSTELSTKDQHTREFLSYTNEAKRFSVGSEESFDGMLKWIGVDFKYHLFGIIFDEKIAATYKSDKTGLLNIDIYKPTNKLDFDLLYAKKEYDQLIGLGDHLDQSIDFGMFAVIAIPIFRGLQFIYKYFPNYGVTIILLTLVIRMLTFPLQYKSFKSMKKMQKVQPELLKIKEKFKDDPQRVQKETMDLFKRAGANPLGGCLPMVAQIPIFLAFWKVLYNAVEFVGAPFGFWLHDLSLKDPYYILPFLFAASMFLQTKLTPSTNVDPMQQKIMLFMPIIFAFMMKDLPSGLLLYLVVSTIFGLIQQLFVYKITD